MGVFADVRECALRDAEQGGGGVFVEGGLGVAHRPEPHPGRGPVGLRARAQDAQRAFEAGLGDGGRGEVPDHAAGFGEVGAQSVGDRSHASTGHVWPVVPVAVGSLEQHQPAGEFLGEGVVQIAGDPRPLRQHTRPALLPGDEVTCVAQLLDETPTRLGVPLLGAVEGDGAPDGRHGHQHAVDHEPAVGPDQRRDEDSGDQGERRGRGPAAEHALRGTRQRQRAPYEGGGQRGRDEVEEEAPQCEEQRNPGRPPDRPEPVPQHHAARVDEREQPADGRDVPAQLAVEPGELQQRGRHDDEERQMRHVFQREPPAASPQLRTDGDTIGHGRSPWAD